MTSNYNAMVINTTNTMLGEFTTIGFIIASPICVAPNTCEYISCGDNWVCKYNMRQNYYFCKTN